jgi:hypothetical protein
MTFTLSSAGTAGPGDDVMSRGMGGGPGGVVFLRFSANAVEFPGVLDRAVICTGCLCRPC